MLRQQKDLPSLQGGNKSTKSFRSDIGIPGYTGFCPAFAALPPPTKGSTERLEKSPDQATFVRLATSTIGDQRTSHDRDTARFSLSVPFSVV